MGVVQENAVKGGVSSAIGDWIRMGKAVGIRPKLMADIYAANQQSVGEGDFSMAAMHKHGREAQVSKDLLDIITETPEDRLKRNGILRQLEIPRYRSVECTVGSFLQNSSELLHELDCRSGRYIPKIFLNDGNRPQLMGCSEKELLPFVKRIMNEGVAVCNRMLITEYFPNWFSFTLVIHMSGEIYAETCLGKHYNIAHGNGDILMSYSADPHTGIRRFNLLKADMLTATELGLIQRSILSAIACIPLVPFQGIASNYVRFNAQTVPLSGVYEGTFTKIDDNPSVSLNPLFFDCDLDNKRIRLSSSYLSSGREAGE